MPMNKKKVANNILGDKRSAHYQKKIRKLKRRYRIGTSNLRSTPTFIIIGAQKCGTTSLYKYLVSHPAVLPAIEKEVHYFDINYHKGENWYRSNFPFKNKLENNNSITGESSPYYIYHPHAAIRIAKDFPDTKLIICLRDPVERAISHYWHEVKLGFEQHDIHTAFELEESRLGEEKLRLQEDPTYISFAHQHFSYIDRGHYAVQIREYLKYFDRSQLLILESKDYFSNVQMSFDNVCDFIGLSRVLLPDVSPKNVGKYKKKTDELFKRELASQFKKSNTDLFGLLQVNYKWIN